MKRLPDSMCTRGQRSKVMYDLPAQKLGRKTSCVKCYEGGNVLVCSHCPIVIHESCMSCTAQFSDSGNFCCPYCLYKQSLAECHQAKENVWLAKNALSCFMDKLINQKIGNLQKSKCPKRKVLDSSTCMQNRKGPTCTKVESMLVEGDELAAWKPKSSLCLGSETPIKEIESSTQKPCVNMDTVGAYQCRSNEKNEQTHEKSQNMDTSSYVPGESKERYSPIQDDYVTSEMEVSSEIFEGLEIGENHCSGEDKGLQNAFHSLYDGNVSVTHEEMGKLVEKHRENLKTVDEGVEKIQLQLNPQETPNCLMRNDNIMIPPEKYSVRIGMAVPLKDVDQSADVERHCVDQEKISMKNAPHNVKKKIVPVESGDLTAKYQEIVNTVEISHGGGERKQIPGESQETSVCLKGRQNITELHKKYDKVYDGKYEVEYYTSQIVVNSKNIGHLAQNREDNDDRQPRVKSSKDNLNLTRKDGVAMTHEESEDPVYVHQETAEKDNKNDNGAVGKEHSQPETEPSTFFTTNVEITRMHEVSDEGNEQSLKTGDCCGRINEKQKEELLINDVHHVLNTVSAVHEDSESGDSSASVGNSFCIEYRVSSKRNSQISESLKNNYQPDGLSESSGVEFSDSEEHEEKTHGKSVKNKDPIKQPAVSHGPRRVKLPWKVEEVEVLKEGVEKFSSTTKKKLPWTKVLDFGRHIFDGTRTPVDLKDKWRNLTSKAL